MATNPKILSFKCTLKDKLGTLISSSVNRDVLTSSPDEGDLLSGLASSLQVLSKGECRTISLSADQAYGFYDPKKVILFPRNKIPKKAIVRSGETVSIIVKSGEIRHFKVLQVFGDMISLDGNHPLVGQDLVFEIEVLESREATQEEISDGLNTMVAQVLH